jgi:multidrug resistance efflux pump
MNARSILARTVSALARFAVTAAVVAVAAFAGWRLWVFYMDAPWTRDARMRADVVQVAADVSGLVSQVLVRDNQHVTQGQVLFRIDPARFQLALAQAQANLTSKQAAAQEAVREMNRVNELTQLSVSTEQQQQRSTTATELGAAYGEAAADRDLAQLNLVRTEVRASVNGIVTNFNLRPGDYVDAGKPVFALVDSDSFSVDAYFEETKLPRIHLGDPATIHVLGEPGLIHGHVESIAAGIADRERQTGPDLLANVNPTFSWVRLAQRVPVRIALDEIPKALQLTAGRTVTVEILPKAGK